jgi:cytochrome bd-type quinol oxidase subunit 2
MTPTLTRRLRLLLAGAAAAGVILAHAAAFLIAEPHSHAREELLASTGHRYWALTITVALAILVGGLYSLVMSRIRAARPLSPGAMFLESAPRLALLQVVGFVLLESIERLSVGHPLSELFTEPVVVIGVVAQILVATLGAAVLALLSRAVDAIVAVLRRPEAGTRRVLSLAPTGTHRPVKALVAVGGRTVRGPPVPSSL